MTSPLTSFVPITFTATPDTPAAYMQLNGLTFYFPPEYIPAIGSGPTNPGTIQAGPHAVKGYLEVVSPTVRRWHMTGDLPTAVMNQINDIPGGSGWLVPASKQMYIFRGTQLAELGVAIPDIIAAWNDLYDAAATNRDAQLAIENPEEGG